MMEYIPLLYYDIVTSILGVLVIIEFIILLMIIEWHRKRKTFIMNNDMENEFVKWNRET